MSPSFYSQLPKKFIFLTFLILFIFAGTFWISRKKNESAPKNDSKITAVAVSRAENNRYLIEKRSYPGNVTGDQEVAIIAKTSGIITSFPYEIGSPIKNGEVIARIDDAGNMSAGQNGFKSNEIQQSELSTEQAKKSYGLAKDVYQDKKNSDGSTKVDKETAKTQKEIAKLQYEAAKINLQASLNNHYLSSPISGFVISRNVSLGDYVSAGETVATVSRLASAKIQFYVNQDEKSDFSKNQTIKITNRDQDSFDVQIKNISPQADPETRRFLIEAYPQKQDVFRLLIGTVVSISYEKKEFPSDKNNFILPLSAITLAQNDSFLLIAKDGSAKKIPTKIIRIIGESAEIKADLQPDDLIIIKGNKLLNENDPISIQS